MLIISFLAGFRLLLLKSSSVLYINCYVHDLHGLVSGQHGIIVDLNESWLCGHVQAIQLFCLVIES